MGSSSSSTEAAFFRRIPATIFIVISGPNPPPGHPVRENNRHHTRQHKQHPIRNPHRRPHQLLPPLNIFSPIAPHPIRRPAKADEKGTPQAQRVVRFCFQTTARDCYHSLPMKTLQKATLLLLVALGLSTFFGLPQAALAADPPAAPYKILATTQIPAAGGIDYVSADSPNRRVY